MDFKRLMAFFAISVAIFAGWEHFFPSPKPNPAQQAAQQQTAATPAKAAAEAALAPARMGEQTLLIAIEKQTEAKIQAWLEKYGDGQ